MNTRQLLVYLNSEYDGLIKKASMYFNKWIETGEDVYKENELLHTGSAHAILRIMEILTIKEGE